MTTNATKLQCIKLNADNVVTGKLYIYKDWDETIQIMICRKENGTILCRDFNDRTYKNGFLLTEMEGPFYGPFELSGLPEG